MSTDTLSIHLLVLPVELYHQVICYLDIKDVFALRRTCKLFLALTKERGLWSMIYARLRAVQALPCSRADFTAMSSAQAERMLLSATKVEASFLHHRERIAYHIPEVKQPYSSMHASTCSWRVLNFISDRFILSVDNTVVIIWDSFALASPSPTLAPTPWAHFTLSNFLGYVDCFSTVYIAIGRPHLGAQNVVIYSVPLPASGATESHHGRLHPEGEFPLQQPTEILKHLDPPTGRALLYLPPNSIQIVHWNDHNKRSSITIEPDDTDQAWNGITSLRFCGPYILCFRVRSVEAYPIPTDDPTSGRLPMLRHRFGPVCYRAVSLSRVRVSQQSSGGDAYTIFMLTNDIFQGMAHYRICLTTTPTPSMTVYVLAKGSILSPDPPPLVPGDDGGARYTIDETVRRMFFSTWSLGSAGLRGVWVDRQRGSIDRRVVAFTTHPSRMRGRPAVSYPHGDACGPGDGAPMMEGTVVHVISSYELRDDVTICAVSEWTGRIALGSRVGAISLL